jgi:alanyl-tRNA synthetase
VVSEGSVASGIRRIEAITGERAFISLREAKSDLDALKDMLKTEEPSLKIEKLLNELKSSEKEIQRLKTGSSKDTIADAIKNAFDFQGIKIVRVRQDGLNQNELRLLADNVRDRLGSGVIVIVSATKGQASIVCMVTKDLLHTLNANTIIKNITNISGGRGGGKADLAQGGSKDIEKLNQALDSILDIIGKSYQGAKASS